jgi:hypothetical protein
MAEKTSQGQADKATVENKTATVGNEDPNAGRTVGADANNGDKVPDEVRAGNDPLNPYPNYDFMTLESLRELAESRGVEINRDVEKAHLITELRAADSGTASAVTRRGAR